MIGSVCPCLPPSKIPHDSTQKSSEIKKLALGNLVEKFGHCYFELTSENLIKIPKVL